MLPALRPPGFRLTRLRHGLLAAAAALLLALPAAAVERQALLRAFDDAAFSYLPGATEQRLLKWEGEVRIAGLGTPSRAMSQAVESLSRDIEQATGLAMGYTEQEVSLLFVFSSRPQEDLGGRWARYVEPFFETEALFRQAIASLEGPGAPPCIAKVVIVDRAIRAALVAVRSDRPDAEAVQCLAHEYLGALGILRSRALPEDSLLKQSLDAFAPGRTITLSDSDRALLWLIYHKDMPHAVLHADGMEIAELLLDQAPGVE